MMYLVSVPTQHCPHVVCVTDLTRQTTDIISPSNKVWLVCDFLMPKHSAT